MFAGNFHCLPFVHAGNKSENYGLPFSSQAATKLDYAYRVCEYFLSDTVCGPTFASLLTPWPAIAFPRLEVYSSASH
jgi:hypothetical protein